MKNLSLLSLNVKPTMGTGYKSTIVLIDREGYRIELTKSGFKSKADAREEALEKITSQYGIKP